MILCDKKSSIKFLVKFTLNSSNLRAINLALRQAVCVLYIVTCKAIRLLVQHASKLSSAAIFRNDFTRTSFRTSSRYGNLFFQERKSLAQ